ncbi:MAG TPA: hypothetical protein VMT22_17075 [Terriglobales bacterium]|nr:hypothetical protein [Terriglobales bacterium]
MEDAEIIRLNIERYRRMLQAKLDPASRRTIEAILREFEAGLSIEESHAPSGQSTIAAEVPMWGSNQLPQHTITTAISRSNERATTKLFAFCLGGIFFAMLVLNAAVY